MLPAREAKLDVLRESLAGQPEAGDPVAAAWRALTAWALAGDLPSDDALPRIRLALQNPSLSPRYLARYAAIEAVIAEHLGWRLATAAGNGGTAVPRGAALAAALVGVFRAGVRSGSSVGRPAAATSARRGVRGRPRWPGRRMSPGSQPAGDVAGGFS